MAGYIGRGVPAQKIRVSGVNLFSIAAHYLGDATLWYKIAALNGLTDPWITMTTELLLPPPTASNGGILQ